VNPITNAEKVKTPVRFQRAISIQQKFAQAIDFSGCVLYDFSEL
jgi:hypothetical protein